MKLQTLSASVRFVDKPEAVSRQKEVDSKVAQIEKAVDDIKSIFSKE